jgi:DnaJ-class molecular chaperone
VGEVAYMDKKFNPEKYGMVACPVCDGCGRIRFPNHVKVCQNCGGFGFIKKEGETVDFKYKPMSTTISGRQ